MFIKHYLYDVEAMKEAALISELVKPLRGIYPRFTMYHVYLILIELLKNQPLGRQALMKKTGLGEASIKTLTKRLREKELIMVDRVAGVLLTDAGKRIAEYIGSYIQLLGYLPIEELCEGDYIGFGVGLKEGINAVKHYGGPLAVRDCIVRYGAEGALVMYLINSKLYLPTPIKLEELTGVREIHDAIRRYETLKNGDAILISICKSGDDNCPSYVVNAVIEVLGRVGC